MNKREKIKASIVLKSPVCFLAFGFGSGLSPVGPGTMGTLAAIPLYLLASHLNLWAYIALTLAMFLIGIWLCGSAERIIGVQDHSGIVWDEFVGLFITLIAVPVQPLPILAGFTLFRFFDIIKPWPIGYLDRRIHGGLGIMLDDVLAGVYAWIVLFLLLRFGML